MRKTYRDGLKQSNPLYYTWVDMIRRCYNPKREAYKGYGGRGITVCERWLNSFENFCLDMGKRPDGTSLERVNNDGPYSPDNCKWATREEQQLNKRKKVPQLLIEHEGTKLTVREWADKLGVTERAIWRRWQRYKSPYNMP